MYQNPYKELLAKSAAGKLQKTVNFSKIGEQIHQTRSNFYLKSHSSSSSSNLTNRSSSDPKHQSKAASSKLTKQHSQRSLFTRHKTQMLNPNIGNSMDAPADEESVKKFRSQVPKQVKTGFSPDQVNLSADSQMDRTSNIFSVSRIDSQRLRRSCDS